MVQAIRKDGRRRECGGFLCKAADGGYALAGCWPYGFISCDAYLARLDEQGRVLWERAYGTYNSDVIYAILPLSDGGFVLGGRAYGPIMIRVNADGDTLWQRTYPSLDHGEIYGLAQDDDGGFVATGQAHIEGSVLLVVLRIDSSGDLQSAHSYRQGSNETGRCIIRTTDGGWLAVGRVASHPWDVLLVKETATGDSAWALAYGNGYFDTGEQVIGWPNNVSTVLSISGSTSGSWGTELTAINENGDTVWQRFYLMSDDWIPWAAFAVDHTNRYVMAGRNRFAELVVIKTHSDTVSGNSVEDREPHFGEKSIRISVAPNPFNSTTHLEFTLPSTQRVSLRLYDVLGREVAVLMNEITTAGKHEMRFDASGLPSGVYLCRLEAGGMGQTRKIVLVK